MSNSFHIQTIQRNGANSSLVEGLRNWFTQEFGHSRFEWSNPEWYLLACTDEELIGRLGLVERHILIRSHKILVGGVSGLIVRKNWRKRGIAKKLLFVCEDVIRYKIGANFGLLLCTESVVPVYQKVGWEIIPGVTSLDQLSGVHVWPRLTMIRRLSEDEWPPGPIDLKGLPW